MDKILVIVEDTGRSLKFAKKEDGVALKDHRDCNICSFSINCYWISCDLVICD